MFDGLKGAIATGLGRQAGLVIGGGVATLVFANSGLVDFLHQACVYLSTQESLTAGFGALGVVIACAFFGVKDKINVNAKMAVAAVSAYQQGVEAQTTTDQSKVAAVATAMKAADTAAPADKAAIVKALKDGTF